MNDGVQAMLLLLEGGVLFGTLLLALRLRGVLALAPLYLVFGAIEGFKYFAGADVTVSLWAHWEVSRASAIYFTASLVTLMAVYLYEDAVAARRLVWSLFYVNLAMSLLSILVVISTHLGNDRSALDHSVEDWLSFGVWRRTVGTVLLLLDALGLIVLFEALRRRRFGLASSAAIAMAAILLFDTIAYEWLTQGFGQSMLGIVVPLAGKAVFALLFMLMLWCYARIFEGKVRLAPAPLTRPWQLLGMLTFRSQFEELREQVVRDPLTGAFNRYFFQTELPEQLRLNARRGEGSALLLLDIDHFKMVNDRFGHSAGDQVLRNLTQTVMHTVRRGDSVCRYGGEELVVLLNSVTPLQAEHIGHQILAAVRESETLLDDAEVVRVTVTIGCACAPVDGDSIDTLFRKADKRLYLGKNHGRNRLVHRDLLLAAV